jgi:ornithine carbamoyltransferase
LEHVRQAIPKLDLTITTEPADAVAGAIAVYTDVWASMGQEAEGAKRRRDFARYQINAALMKAAPEAYFMHCLPAHRGQEVTDEVIDGPQSIVVQQAANRMHVQKGILAWLLASRN